MIEKPFLYVVDPELLPGIYEDLASSKRIYFDCETTRNRSLDPELKFNEGVFKPGLDPYLSEIRLLQVANSHIVYVIDLFYCPDISIFGPIFDNPKILKCGHNIKFDIKMLTYHYGFRFHNLYDTMLASLVMTNGIKKYSGLAKHKLNLVIERFLKIPMDKTQQTSDWGAQDLSIEQIKYAADDVAMLEDLLIAQSKHWVVQLPNKDKINLLDTIRLESNCAAATALMELNGLYIDKDMWDAISFDLDAKYANSTAELKAALGKPDINLKSPAQVKAALADKGIKLDSTDAKILQLHAKNPIIKLLLDNRALAKLLTSYGNGISGVPRKKGKKETVYVTERIHPISNRIHADFHQCITDTGRFSCTNPNLQQVPSMAKAKFREAIKGQNGNSFIVCDLSNFEMRIIAGLSKDKNLMRAFNMGGDIHSATAALMFNVPVETIQYKDPVTGEKIKGPNIHRRQESKCINFGLAYGRGVRSLAEQLDCTVDEAKGLLKIHREKYPEANAWLDKMALYASKNLASVTPYGRIRYFDLTGTPSNEYSSAMAGVQREGKNTPIQGCNADVIKLALVRLYDALAPYGDKVKIVNVVHDEIDAECPTEIVAEVAAIIKQEMEEAGLAMIEGVKIVAEVEYGEHWGIKE